MNTPLDLTILVVDPDTVAGLDQLHQPDRRNGHHQGGCSMVGKWPSSENHIQQPLHELLQRHQVRRRGATGGTVDTLPSRSL